ncbi:glycerol-3-phosphate dehydrogenase [Massilia sp. CF038]|uniref:glycerol-3-phosphate dehydrogenase n=1 Tax=Massilia sp. CF038 TaxID=1881045 RepID=UPI00090F7CC4|nr:glycerol-3-phosphate dehydrogenase [Massilia sp. CF038]SHG67470.1 homodimeric glycerol 3-phosphate dehydrogenase (quinone) [Massilia sp. CF038]
MKPIECDLLVVGGGINGTGIARDAAGRGLSVMLCEKDDLASHTSSASSKLIHGGLRYLEYYEFGLVRKALIEREVLLRSAPHIMWPMRFVMPHDRGQRPAWMIRAGLYLYDTLARREFLPGSQAIHLRQHRAGSDLKPEFTRGFVYSDGWVDDARLVVLNALDARERGAQIHTRTRCSAVQRGADGWRATLSHADGATTLVKARCLVNAAGPWASEFLHGATSTGVHQSLRLIKGSHIVVPRLFDHDYAYIFQHPDGRIVFAIPYEQDFTLIGTTDLDYQGDLNQVAISAEEITYLCTLSNHYFSKPITPADVVWTYSGVRPLVQDDAAKAAAATRDFRLEHDTDGAPMLTVFGGKITTARKLAEEALDWIAPLLGNRHPAWTAQACLPGGDLYGERPTSKSVLEFTQWVIKVRDAFPWLPPAVLQRYARAYGTRVYCLLSGCSALADLGAEIVPGLFEVEARYLIEREWARTAEDILWRRSKLGLHAGEGSAATVDAWIRARTPPAETAAPVRPAL